MTALFEYTLKNLTPLALRVAAEGQQPFTLRPCEQRKVYVVALCSLSVFDDASGYKLREISLDHASPEIAILPEYIRSAPNKQQTHTTVRNMTDTYCDVCWRNSANELVVGFTLGPGEACPLGTRVNGALEFRSTFGGELVGMYVTRDDASQTVDITSAYAEGLRRVAPLLPVVPWATKLELVEGLGPEPKPDSRDYIAIAEYESGKRNVFNGSTGVITRTVRISGVKLVWGDDDESGLMAWNGARDIENLEIVADHLVVASPLRFPGANVAIRVRILEFQDTRAIPSSIDITPLPFLDKATTRMTSDGKYPADAEGNPVYKGADGTDGQDCGTLSIDIRELWLPSDVATKRFRAVGGNGQEAQPGGHKPYVHPQSDQPANGKDVPHVTAGDIRRKLQDTFVVAKREDAWRWPGEVDRPARIMWNGQQLFVEEAEKSHVTCLKLFATDATVTSADLNEFYFPTGEHVNHSTWNPVENPEVFLAPEKVLTSQKHNNTRPGDGEDAYPGGKPGAAGKGGHIFTSLPVETVKLMCDYSAGTPGAKTAAVQGLRSGNPNPAYRVTMKCVKHSWIEASIKPTLTVEDVSPKNGADAAEISGGAGSPGSLSQKEQLGAMVSADGACIRLATGKAQAWIDPAVVDAVIACAKDMYRNGYRSKARSLLEPYLAEMLRLPDDDPDYSGRLVAIKTMAGNLRNNLDYFGHPAGWVPRIQASANFQVYKEIRRQATEILLFARSQLAAFEGHAAVAVRTSEITTALSSEVDSRRTLLESSYGELADARDALVDVEAQVAEATLEIEDLRKWVADNVREKVQAQRAFKGIMKLAAGAMQVCPVGQPYLGMAGSVVSSVGDFDWNAKDPGAQWGGILKKVGGQVDTFLTDNKDIIAEDRSPTPDNRNQLRSLEDQINQAKIEMKGAQKRQEQAAERFEQDWKDDNVAKQAALKKVLDGWQKDIDDITSKQSDPKLMTADEKRALENAKSEKDRLVAQMGEEWAGSVIRARDKASSDIKLLEEKIKEAEAQKRQADKERLKAEKDSLAEYSASLEGLETKQKEASTAGRRDEEDTAKSRAETKTALQRLKSMGAGIGSIGDGIAVLATPVGPDDPEVQSIVDDILDPSKDIETPDDVRDRYRKLIKNLGEIKSAQQGAMTRLSQANQVIAANTAGIAQGLTALSELSRRSQILAGVQDMRIKRHLQDMASRARDSIAWSVYHFVMAFRYEFLMDVPQDLFNVDHLIDAIAKAALVDADGKIKLGPDNKPLTLETIAPADYEAIEEKVLKDQMLELALNLLSSKQKKNPLMLRELSPPSPIAVNPGATGPEAEWSASSAAWLDTLRRSRVVWLDPVKQMKLVMDYKTRGLRIRNVILRDIVLDRPAGSPSIEFTLRFLHPGVSVIYEVTDKSPSGSHYLFSKGPQDDAVSWIYRCLWNDGNLTFVQDKVSPDDMILNLLDKRELVLTQYNPGLYTDRGIGIALDYTMGEGEAFPPIKKIDFRIAVELTGDSPIHAA